ncbi:MAG: cytochrome c3 family protein [Firmicutes bacterium]|nr:cytochrome c3 family protein [Bacillota bacterium]
MFASGVRRLTCLCLGIATVAAMTALAWATQAPDASTYDGDCSRCHATQQVLPASHVPTAGLRWEDCVECHDPVDELLTLRGRLPLGHLHGLRGIPCTACHVEGVDSAPEGDGVCVDCHGSLDQITTGAAGDRPNPHDAHYQGLECTFCHHMHRPSEDFCLQCHDFGYRIP